MNKIDIYTISAQNVITEEDVTPMYLCKNYYSQADAEDDARKLADSLKDDEEVVEVTVYAGEYEDADTGNIFGENFDIFTATNTDKEKSMAARKEANYVRLNGLDYYAGE